jgi:hypothetical protein
VLAVTTRATVRARLRELAAGFGLPTPVFVEHVGDVLSARADVALLVLDLGSCSDFPGLGCAIRGWASARSAAEVVVFAPLLQREAELRAAVSIAQGSCSANVRVLTASEFYSDDVWRTLVATRERSILASNLERDFRSAVHQTGRSLCGEPVVLELLREISRPREMPVTTTALLGRQRRANPRSAQKALWKQLVGVGQLPPSQLVLVFRVLWYAKLRECRWTARRIAAFLGFRSPRHLRRSLARRLGVGTRALRQVRYADALNWAAMLVTSPRLERIGYPVRALISLLMKCAVATVGSPRQYGNKPR